MGSLSSLWHHGFFTGFGNVSVGMIILVFEEDGRLCSLTSLSHPGGGHLEGTWD